MLIQSLILISLHIITVSCQIKFGLSKRSTSSPPPSQLNKRDSTHLQQQDNSIKFIDDTIAYYVNISVGSNGQNILAVLDTGSSDLWFPGPENSKCSNGEPIGDRFVDSVDFPAGEAKNVSNSKQEQLTELAKEIQNYCSDSNVFNYHNSTSWNSNETEFKITYLDGSLSTGVWGTDSIEINGLKLDNFSFAVTNNSNASAILGIGFLKSETTYLINENHYTYPNFPQRLKDDGYIEKVTYSLSSGKPGDYEGVLLVGGVDHNKYIGDLKTIPMISDSRTAVTLSAIGIDNESNGIETISSTFYETLLDSGTTTANFPKPLLETIAQKLGSSGKTYNRDSYEYYDVDCSYAQDDSKNASIYLDFQGKIISVPLSNAITKHEDQCLLKIVSLTDDIIILGDIFLSSMYVVYDLEDREISIAQLNTDADPSKEDIEKINGKVPQASRVSNYTNVYTDKASETTTHDVFATVLV